MNNNSRNALVTHGLNQKLDVPHGTLELAGKAANQAAEKHRFSDYQLRRAAQTLRRQQADLNLFTDFLRSVNLKIGNLFQDATAWNGITWGFVEAFIKWQLIQGYALPSINIRLSTIKTYARLAMQSGVLSPQEFALIRSIQSYTHKEQPRIDSRRAITRLGDKKKEAVSISELQAKELKSQPDEHSQGRRDNVLMCLLLDHGLRVGELSLLTVDMLDLNNKFLRFYRPKVNKVQTHRLSPDTYNACMAYYRFGDMPDTGPLLRRSKKNCELGKAGMTERAITQRVNVLGKQLGIFGLSAHDCRHYWATTAARHGTDPFSLQEAGGWASLAMPRRYIQNNEISNDGVILDK